MFVLVAYSPRQHGAMLLAAFLFVYCMLSMSLVTFVGFLYELSSEKRWIE